MKQFLLLLCAFVGMFPVKAEDSSTTGSAEVEKNTWGGKLIQSPFGLGLDIQTKYIWRGME
ncbi:MAG: hypothetical protein K2J78_05040, partial [Muribaculaceae bacterium]|nr:hypothetical protein [Muribaculaceae bacterium]